MIINTDLSAAAKAGALDASLAYSSIYTQHSDLMTQTALSGIQGLQSLLAESGAYAAALSHMRTASESIDVANELALKDPFIAGTSAQQTAAINSVRGTRTAEASALLGNSQSARNEGVFAYNDSVAAGNNMTVPTEVYFAGEDMLAAQNALINNDNPGLVNAAVNRASNAYNQAIQAYNALPANPANKKAAALRVMNAAYQILTAGQALQALANTPAGRLRGITPTVSDLGNGYVLSNWGNTGLVTITGPDNQGIIIDQNGNVDPLNGGKGWKFNSTSTFILPGETKVTINPGSPANILVSRGIHAFTVTGIANGQNATVGSYSDLNGREVDRSTNDGHIIRLTGTNTSSWQLNGNTLGDAGSREVVATTAITNELKLDPTDVLMPNDWVAYINSIGLNSQEFDYDGDNRFNNEELGLLAMYLAKDVERMQAAYNEALSRISLANQTLMELNEMLDELRRQSDNTQDERAAENSAARAELKAIEKRLVAALQLLRETTPGGAPAQGGNIEQSASQVLDQLTQISQQGGLKPTTLPVANGPQPTSPPPAPTPGINADSPLETLGQPVGGQQNDPVGDGLRRAGRLLSGLGLPPNLNFLEMPETQGATGPGGTGAGAAVLPQVLDELAAALASAAQGLGGTGGLPEGVNAQTLEAGLGGLLTALAEQGVLDLEALQAAEDLPGLLQLLSTQLGGLGSTETQPKQGNEALLGFLGSLSVFGSAAAAVAPQAGQTTPGQVEKAGTGSLAPQSATARQLQEVLAGLAALGSAGAAQSTNNEGADAPTSAELRLGLQAFLAAFAAQGVFGTNQAQDQQAAQNGQNGVSFTGNTQQIAAISGNFYTDPELLKQLRANLNRAIQVQSEQLSRASTLFSQSQEIVQKFVNLVKEDDVVRDIIQGDELSDEQQEIFADKMTELRKDWGMEWGSDDNRTPASQSNLVSKAVQSGMMV